jgi:DNA-binding response OmpR family regulator
MATTPPAQSARVLVVEDDPDLRETIGSVLEARNYSVALAASAVEATAARKFDLALLDLNLPDGSGLDVLSAWRSAGVDVPVLILTAERAPEVIESALMRLDAWDFLAKPFDVESLERAIERSLALARERRDIERRMAG